MCSDKIKEEKSDMKKAIALILVLLMALSLFACGSNGGNGTQQGANFEDAEDIGMGETLANGTAGADYDGPKTGAAYYGFFDNEYDYTKDERYSVAYVVYQTSVLYDAFSAAFELWANRYNCDYKMVDCGGNADTYINQMQTLVDNGVKGFLLDPDSQMLGRVTEYAQELVGDAWMSGMSYPYGEDGLMNHPFVGFDNYDFGVQECTYVVNYAKENFEGWTPEEIGCININYSTSELINNRMFGARDTWKELMPEAADNFWDLDAAAIGMTKSAAYDLVSNLLAQHPEITYWCINATIDQFATGANSAIEQYGLLDNTVICVLGGTGLVNQWDQGVENAWKGAIYTAQPVYAEPIFGIMYYMMRGWCTAEEVWQDYTNVDSNGYGWLLLASEAIEYDTYQNFLEWVDWHSGFNWSNYGEWDGTKYTILLDPSVYNSISTQ